MSGKKSMKFRAIGWSSCILACFMLLFCVAGFFLFRELLLRTGEEKALTAANTGQQLLDARLQFELQMLETAANDLSAGTLPLQDPAALQSWLTRQVERGEAAASYRLLLDKTGYVALRDPNAITQPDEPPEALMKTDWYLDAKEQGRTICAAPRFDRRFNASVTTIAAPLLVNGQPIGVLSADLYTAYLMAPFLEADPPEGAYPILLDREGGVLFHRQASFLPGGSEETAPFYLKNAGGGLAQVTRLTARTGGIAQVEDYDGVTRCFAAAVSPLSGWTALYATDPALYTQPLFSALWLLCGIGLIAVLLCASALWGVFTWSFAPLERLQTLATQMRSGRLSTALPPEHNPADTCELAELAETLEGTCKLLRTCASDIGHTLGRMARGDFTVQLGDEEYPGDFAPIKTAINAISDSLHDVFTLVNDAARQTMGGSYQISGFSGRLSAGVNTQNGSVEALATSMEELRRQISGNASNAGRANSSSHESDVEIRNCRLMLNQLSDAIGEARAAVIKMNSPTAESVYATGEAGALAVGIAAEAARGGDEQLYFYTASKQIHSLTEQSGTAAQRAALLVAQAEQATARSLLMLNAVADSLRTLAEQSARTSSAVSMITTASDLQNKAVNKVRQDVGNISAVVHSNAQVAEQCSVSSVELTRQAQVLAKILSAFYTKDSATKKGRAGTHFSAREEDYTFRE